MYEEFAKNLSAANDLGSSNIYQNYARAGRINMSPNAVAGGKARAEVTVDAAKKENEAKKKANARAVLLPNNEGYAFLDGDGNRIGINQFSMLTGQRPDQILKDSPAPKDQKFVQDYNTMTTFTNAWVNGDQETLAKMRAADPEKFNQLISNYKSPGEVVKAFTDYWSDYYRPGEPKQDSATPSFSPRPTQQPIDEQTANVLASSSLDQILTPMTNMQPPRPLQGFEKVNPFAGQRDALNRYQDYLKQNPWFTYQNSLMGL